jgi:putative membrane protein
MKVTLMALTGLLAVVSFCACNNNDDNSDTNNIVNSTDSAFVTQASISDSAEINVAQLALTKSQDTAILNFANMMIMDHTLAQASLRNIAGRYGIIAKDSLDPAHIEEAAKLMALTGRAFDSAYIHGQVTDHNATIQLFSTEGSNGNNNDLQNFADTTLPKLQMHLDRATSIASRY